MDDNQPPVPPVAPQQSQPNQPAVGAPSAYVAPQKKSHTGLIIGLVIGGIVFLLLIGGIIMAVIASSGAKKSTTTNTTDKTAVKSGPADTSTSKAAYTAKYTSELSKVCDGIPIANAAAYTSKSAAIIQAYEMSPEKTTWSSVSVGYGKSYDLPEYNDFEKVSVVVCAKATTGAETPSIPCTGKSTDPVVNYHSAKYTVTFYEARTGKKIGDETTVESPADNCPSFMMYNGKTNNSFASVERDQLEAVIDTFVR